MELVVVEDDGVDELGVVVVDDVGVFDSVFRLQAVDFEDPELFEEGVEDEADDAELLVVLAMFAVAFAMLATQAFMKLFARFHMGLFMSGVLSVALFDDVVFVDEEDDDDVVVEDGVAAQAEVVAPQHEGCDVIMLIMLDIFGMFGMPETLGIIDGFILVNMFMVRSNMAMFCLPISSNVEPKGNMPPKVDWK